MNGRGDGAAAPVPSPTPTGCDQVDLIEADYQLQLDDSASSKTGGPAAGGASNSEQAKGSSTTEAAKKRLRSSSSVLLRSDQLEYGPEVFDMVKLVFGGQLGYHQPWPWWLKYNPLFWFMYVGALVLMVVGDRFHRAICQGGPVPSEGVAERRLRVHWVYQFNAYLLLCACYYTIEVIVIAASHGRGQGDMSFGVGLLVICLVWVLCNAWGLSAMFRKNALMMRMYVAANCGWTVLLLLLLIAECVGYKRFRTAVAFHVLTVLFFLIFDYLYFLGMWSLYPLPPHQRLLLPLCVLATVVFLLAAMFTIVTTARSELWYLLSGTI